MEETFLPKIDSIAKELGVYERLIDEYVNIELYFNEQGLIFYCELVK